MGGELEQVGMVGQYVAAILQTAGVYAQGQVLAIFADWIHHLGMLLFFGSGIAALVSLTLYGRYQNALYFLLGPPLAVFCIWNTTQVAGTNYQFGQRSVVNNIPIQLFEIDDPADPRYDNPAVVSWVFLRFDQTVSYVMQRAVAALIDTTVNRDDLINHARERMFTRIARGYPRNPQFQRLLGVSLLGHCAEYLRLGIQLRELSNPNREFDHSTIERAGNDLTWDSTANLRAEQKTLIENRLSSMQNHRVPLDNNVVDFLTQPKMAPYIAGINLTPVDSSGNPVPVSVTCNEVWQLTLGAAVLAASEDLAPNDDELSQILGVDWAVVIESVVDRFSDDDMPLRIATLPTGVPNTAPGIALANIAARYIHNAMGYSPTGHLTAQIDRREQFNSSQFEFVMGEVAEHHAASNVMMTVHFAAYIPYMQGALLYLLTFTFPFFALLLVTPQTMSGAMVWVTAWIWVKSWDVGFAVVHAIRKILWEALPGIGPREAFDGNTLINFQDVSSVWDTLYNQDPIATNNTYYFIVSVLTLSVPFVTAHLTMGSSNFYSALKSGIDRPSIQFSNDVKKAESRNPKNPTASTLDLEAAVAYQGPGLMFARMAREANGGGETLSGVSRRGAGDSTLPSQMRAQAGMGEYLAKGSYGAREPTLKRAAVTNRRMDFNAGGVGNAIQSQTYAIVEGILSRGATGQAMVPGIGSDRPGVGPGDFGSSGPTAQPSFTTNLPPLPNRN